MSVARKPSRVGRFDYHYNLSYTLSKTFDYSNDDQLENGIEDEQVERVEGRRDRDEHERGVDFSSEMFRLKADGNE